MIKTSMWRSVKWMFDRTGNVLLQPPARTAFGRVPTRVDGEDRRVALTFDDGPSEPATGRVLDALASVDAPATFFCVGEMVTWYPETVRRAYDEGHVIASHSMWHSRMQSLSFLHTEHIDAAQTEIESVIGRRPRLYRPPWGWTVAWEVWRLKKRGMAVVGWDVYPDDWTLPEQPAETTVGQVMRDVRAGSIVLMHDATSGVRNSEKRSTAEAVLDIVEQIRDRGLEIVPVHELLGVSPYLDDAAQ